MKRTLVVVVLVIMTCYSYAQNLVVSGNVRGSNGETIPGVGVIVAGTSTGTVTNIDGNYTLEVSADATLLFSFLGYTQQEVPVDGKSVINVVMLEESVEVNEVVVTALGITQSKKALGYSTQSLGTEQISTVNTANLGSQLNGQVAGLTVNNPTGLFQTPEFLLRGKSPLMVIDGIPVETDFYDVSSSDVAEVTVLKGTSASALYGSRGRNGAILITTKSASVDGLTVKLNHKTMMTAGFTVFPETQTEYGNGSNGLYEFWDGQDGGISDGDMIWGPKFSDNLMIAQWNSPIYDNVTGETIEWYGDVSGTQYDDKSRYSRVPIAWKYHNNLEDFLETGFVTSTDLSIEQKSEKALTRFSINYTKQKGQVPNTELQTGGLSYLNSYKLSRKLTLDTKLSYNKVFSPNYPRYGYGPKNHMYTILIWMGDDVNGGDLEKHMYVPGQEGYRQANFNYAWYNNPYFAAHELNQRYDKDVMKGQMKLKWDIANNLSIQGRTSGVINKVFENRESPKTYLNYGDPREGDYKTWNNSQVNIDNDVLLSYNNQLASELVFTLNTGASTFYKRYQQEYNATDGLIVPKVYSLNNSAGNVIASTYVQEKAIRSVYGMANFDWKDALFLTVAARNDWSSTLPGDNNSYFYPSASLSGMVSNMVKLPDFVDYLKVYGSWAEVSSDLDPYKIAAAYSNNGNYGGVTRLTYPSGIINPAIEPEKSTSYELGLASNFASNRIGFDLTYYNVVDENQIIDLSISEASGFTSRKVNGNEYTTQGYELMVNAVPVKSASFQWNMSVNMSHMVKRITDIYGGAEKYGDYSLNERVDNYYSTAWMKAPDGQLIVREDTGLPVRDPFPRAFGHTEPDVRFGFINNIKYGRFQVNVDFDGVIGGVLRSVTVEKMWWGGKHPNSTTYRDQQYASSEPVYVPTAVNVVSGDLVTDINGNVISDNRVFKTNTTAVNWQTWGQNYPYRARVTTDESETFANMLPRTFVKLRRLSVSYDASELLSIPGVKNIELSAFGYNLWMWKEAMIIDPDYGNDDNLQDPSARYLGLGINMTF
jgi:TonB-linked SusC/RagA family outer membrane protein